MTVTNNTRQHVCRLMLFTFILFCTCSGDDGTPGYYEQAITSLASVFTRSQHVINHSAACSLMTSIQPFLMWTGNEKV